MALMRGNTKSAVNPQIVDRRGLSETDRKLSEEGLRKLISKRKNNDISKEEFQKFVRVRDSGVTNMFDTRAVSQFSGLDKEKIMSIMKNFNSLSRKFPGVVR